MAQEKNFENRVKNFLRDNNIWYIKIFGGGFQRAGIPDLLCCIDGLFMAIELKSENGTVSELQKMNIDKIKKSGGIAIILYPHQFAEFKKIILKELGGKNNG